MISDSGKEYIYLKLNDRNPDITQMQIPHLDRWSNIVCMCHHY